MNKKILLIILFFIFGLFGLLIILNNSTKNKLQQNITSNPYLIINNIKINVSIADAPAKWSQGLSFQKTLGKNEGMIFIFPEKEISYFWMKDMNFPLDIVWIDENEIIKIDKNLAPEGASPINRYSSEMAVNYVLEVNAGFCDEHNIKVGDKVEYYLN